MGAQMRELLARAAEYGIRVHAAHLEGDMLGCYVQHQRRIYFDLSLSHAERRSVVAHELGHAHHRHDCESAANERQADAYAAALLVDPKWYAELEQINHSAAWIAEEMDVAPWVVEAYREYCLQRLGMATYSRARMGHGQWDHRFTL